MVSSTVAATLTALIGILHSFLGERFILGPLWTRTDRQPDTRLSNFHRRTLRAAWHATTIAWWAMALMLVAPEHAGLMMAGALASTGLLIFTMTRGAHFGWPLFMIAAYASASAGAGRWLMPSAEARGVIAVGLSAVFGLLAAFHLYWAAGGRRGLPYALPTDPQGRRLLVPNPAATLVVTAGLLALTWLPWLALHDPWARRATALAAAAFGLRVLGDLRLAGTLKRVRGTAFARADDLVYVPLCFALSAGLCVVVVG